MAYPNKGLREYWAKHKKGKSKKSGKGRSMWKSKSNRRSNKVRLPVAVILGFMPLVAKGVNDIKSGGFQGLKNTVPALIPYNPATGRMDWSQLHWGLWPILAGVLVHKIAGGYLGINRAIGRMGIPWVRI